MVDPGLGLPVATQCSLLGLARSTYYYKSKNRESDLNLTFMEEIDRLYLAHPENGSRMMTKILRRRGHEVNRKRVQRLMQLMGLRSLAPQPKTTKAHPDHPKYPYLLRGLSVDHPNHVWCADITYVPFKKGFLYLVAIMDWHSRKVLTWRVSNTMTSDFCVAALTEALALYGTPKSSIRTRDRSSRHRSSPVSCTRPASRSPWTEWVGPSTTSSSSGCGARSNTITST